MTDEQPLHFLVMGMDSATPEDLWAYCIELPGCLTQSFDGTMDSLRKNIQEALDLYLDEEQFKPYQGRPVKLVYGRSYLDGFNDGWACGEEAATIEAEMDSWPRSTGACETCSGDHEHCPLEAGDSPFEIAQGGKE